MCQNFSLGVRLNFCCNVILFNVVILEMWRGICYWVKTTLVFFVLSTFSTSAVGRIVDMAEFIESSFAQEVGQLATNADEKTDRLVVFTALFGHLDDLRKQPEEEGVDYICFTDRKEYGRGVVEGWKIIYIDRLANLDGRRMNRHVKILPHLYLDRNVTRSLYIDATIDLKKRPWTVFNFFLPPQRRYNFGHNLHPERRRNWKDEVRVTIERGRGNKTLLLIQEEAYERRNVSLTAWKGFFTNFLLARIHSVEMREFSELWWNELVQYSERDQVGLAGALHEDSVVQRKYRIRQRRVPCWLIGNAVFRKRLHSLYKGSLIYQRARRGKIPYNKYGELPYNEDG